MYLYVKLSAVEILRHFRCLILEVGEIVMTFSPVWRDSTSIIRLQIPVPPRPPVCVDDRCTMRVGKGIHPDGVPGWCQGFSLDGGSGVRAVKVIQHGNRPGLIYNIGQ